MRGNVYSSSVFAGVRDEQSPLRRITCLHQGGRLSRLLQQPGVVDLIRVECSDAIRALIVRTAR